MIDLPKLKFRVARLEDLTAKLGKEVERCKAGGPLMPQEWRAYLNGIQDALTARVTLAAAVKRMGEAP
jgi:hypothetical protein